MNCRIGMGQILVEGGALGDNLGRACAMIEDAARHACEAVVLPECLDLGWTYPGAREMACPIPGPTSDRLAEAARKSGIHVVAGLTERAGERIYNAAVLISPEGEILARHRKINELDIAQDLYATGDAVRVTRTPLGMVGITICADNFPDSLVFGHTLARMGAQLLLSPCAWAVDAGHDNQTQPYGGLWLESYSTLARLYDITVVGVSNVGWLRSGPWAGRKCIGCSIAMGPAGLLAMGPYGDHAESLTVVETEIRPCSVTGTTIAAMLRERGYQGP